MVNSLQRFENFFERLMEGSVGRIFRTPIQPAEIGRRLERAMEEVCRAEPLVRLQYAAVVDAETLQRLGELGDRPARALIAARVGETRLIDNAALP